MSIEICRDDKNYFKVLYKALLNILKDVHKVYCSSNFSEKDIIRNLHKKDSNIEFMVLDNNIKEILITNGCKKLNDNLYCKLYKINDPKVEFLLVFNMVGNEICNHYDYINLNQNNTIVIFAESFKGLFLNEPDETFGRSSYIDILIEIAELYIAITTNYKLLENDQKFSCTAVANNYRLLPTLISYFIIKKIFGSVNENDVFGYDYKDLMNKLNNFTLDEICNGIRLKL